MQVQHHLYSHMKLGAASSLYMEVEMESVLGAVTALVTLPYTVLGQDLSIIWKLAWFEMSKLQWKNRYSFHDQRDPSFSKQTAPSATSAAFFPFSKLIKNTYILTKMWYMGDPKVGFNQLGTRDQPGILLPLESKLPSPAFFIFFSTVKEQGP